MKKYVNGIEELLGNTPMLKLNRFFPKYNVFAKLEYYNPTFSIKDRAAFNMVSKKVKSGSIKTGDTIIEATSGNTGLGLCLAAIIYNLKFIAVVFDDVSQEKINMLKGYGAMVIICDSKLNSNEKGGYVWVAKKISERFDNIHLIDQFNNIDNPLAHYDTTGPEIYQQLDGQINFFINTIGTGGTLSGVSKYLKEMNDNIKAIGVEPVGGIYKNYFLNKEYVYADHLIHSISDNFISNNFWNNYIDEVVQVEDRESFETCIELMKIEGLCVGTSAGCTIAAIKKLIKTGKIKKNDIVVCTLADNGIKYSDSLLNYEYLKKHNLNSDFLICNRNDSVEIEKYLKQNGIYFEVK